MSYTHLKQWTEKLLRHADVSIDGKRPWDIQVKNKNLYRRVFVHGSLGFGEAYMDGWWDAESLDELVSRLMKAQLDQHFKSIALMITTLKAKLLNCQSPRRAYQVGVKHYDIGNDLYINMLDSRMIYSCGYWKNAQTLEEAQRDKLDLTCRKLHLKKGQRVLDIGCGWGGCARYMAENYGVEVVGITISKEQAALARDNCRQLPIEILVKDYRELQGRFDRIVSIGMFEHVGYKNYRNYFKTVEKLLADDGLFLLHTIGSNTPTEHTDPWIDRYIFPNGMLPSAQQISSAFEDYFILEDWHSFGPDYDKTLLSWYDNFNEAWSRIKKNYDDRFRRMWNYYLLASAGSFRARKNQLWQIVLSKQGLTSNYRYPR
ncbi:cyclopropane-fatty-acyl-phospholipid synthase [Desulfuromusa kysingii]|uniref:Cyclopropane-fatty-acyl-phospholipid synthase n=1 Tax=Desulfuromusa kysingii TaxID=37625 RepID=A0A1H3YVT3_9BACT|nr:cyclopropane fatty acyl phospholipid synthase [Desulfuromusa kysingii]SEA15134.1 cyclopropane-fatty-acyl-phospholipid synthase [Desulfuromusa kysingii]